MSSPISCELASVFRDAPAMFSSDLAAHGEVITLTWSVAGAPVLRDVLGENECTHDLLVPTPMALALLGAPAPARS